MIRIEDQTLYGTVYGYSKFIKSAVWRDMQNELEVWKSMAESEYRTAGSMEDVARIQGRVEAIDELLTLPERLLEAVEMATNKNYPKEQNHGREE